jgi:transcriptional regulator with XRE-family HTH domain
MSSFDDLVESMAAPTGASPVRPELASMNYDAQKRLVADLGAARRAARRTLEDVADSLRVDVQTVEDLESGRRSPSMRELRLWAHAADAFVSYTVTPDITSYFGEFQAAVDSVVASEWAEVVDESIDEVVVIADLARTRG